MDYRQKQHHQILLDASKSTQNKLSITKQNSLRDKTQLLAINSTNNLPTQQMNENYDLEQQFYSSSDYSSHEPICSPIMDNNHQLKWMNFSCAQKLLTRYITENFSLQTEMKRRPNLFLKKMFHQLKSLATMMKC